MKILKEHNEIIDDLIEHDIKRMGEESFEYTTMDLLRYGCEGYIHMSSEQLINEALKKKIYCEEVKEIEIK